MSIHQPMRRWCLILALSSATIFTSGQASNGARVGLAAALPQGGVVATNLHAALPMVRYQHEEHTVHLAGRLDLTAPVDFSAPPAIGLSTVLMSDTRPLKQYLGGGVGISFLPQGEASGVVLSTFAYTGIWMQLSGSWGLNLEGSVNLSGAGILPSLTLGVSYIFGADQ